MTAQPFRYTTKVYSFDATMSSSTNQTGVIDMIGTPLIGIKFPTAFKGKKVFINISTDGTTFLKAYNPQGVRFQVVAQANSYVAIAPDDFRGVRYIQLESDGIEGTDRSFTVFGRVD